MNNIHEKIRQPKVNGKIPRNKQSSKTELLRNRKPEQINYY